MGMIEKGVGMAWENERKGCKREIKGEMKQREKRINWIYKGLGIILNFQFAQCDRKRQMPVRSHYEIFSCVS